MRALVALAVLGVCSGFPHQAYNSPLPPYPSYGNSYADPLQPKWTGPMASEVPAGIDGLIIPVDDTYEVSAAKKAFFDAYEKQLSAVGSASYAPVPDAYNAPVAALAPVYNAIPVAPSYVSKVPSYSPPVPAKQIPSYAPPAPAKHVPSYTPVTPAKHIPSYPQPAHAVPSYNALSVNGAVPKNHIEDTPEVAAAKAQFFHLYNEQAAAAAAAPDDPIDYNAYH